MLDKLSFGRAKPTVAVIRLQGVIAAGGRSGALSDAALASNIERAFRRGKPKAIALVINSPGGSPVQSSLIAARIRRLADEKDVPVFAFVEDVAASGGYWLASAADQIYVDQSSIVGSIGVISAGFGFQDLIQRHGVERRVYTAGTSKSQLDAFQAEKAEDVARLEHMLDDIHQIFIQQVKDRRGARLSDEPEIFTGAFWTGARGVELGLADGIGHLVPVMKEKFGEKVKFQVYGPKRRFMQRFGLSIVDEALSGLNERAAFARFGL